MQYTILGLPCCAQFHFGVEYLLGKLTEVLIVLWKHFNYDHTEKISQ